MPNERLAEILRLAGLSNKALARRVQELSARRGREIRCDHTSVSRWLSGTTPREATAWLIAEVLSSETGRSFSLDDIGLTASQSVDARLGLDYDTADGQNVGPLETLWNADLQDIRTVVSVEPEAHAWSGATLQWLLRAESGDTRHQPTYAVGRAIGNGDVQALRATIDAFASLDDRFGGGHARKALIQYLHTDVAGMLTGRLTEASQPALFSAAAEGTLLAAWMSYDAGLHGLAQRYFIQALKLADVADNPLLGGTILDAMSHQATYLGRSADAVNLARAARSGTRGIATAGVTAHFHAMEARALAVGGDSVGAGKALNSTVRVFEKREPGRDPEWISYFDDTELSAEFSHCFRDLGRHKDALTYAARATSGASNRSDFFVRMVEAASHLATPDSPHADPDLACDVASEAIRSGSQLKSARCIRYLTDFRRQLEPFETSTAVRDLVASMEDNPLWESAAITNST